MAGPPLVEDADPAANRPTRVLISYAHEGRERDYRAQALSDTLRSEGVECEIDNYVDSPPGGWPQWIGRLLNEADFILVVCSETYRRRFDLGEDPGKGKGVKYEGKLIRALLYEAEGVNNKIVPIVFESDDLAFVPLPLKDVSYYDLSGADGYESLYRRLTGQPRIIKQPVGRIRRFPPHQPSPIPEVFAVIQEIPGYIPLEVLALAIGMDEAALRRLLVPLASEGLCTIAGTLISTTYGERIEPAPANRGELFGQVLDRLLDYADLHRREPAGRAQCLNVLAMAKVCRESRPASVARVFRVLDKALKHLGNKRLVLEAAEMSIDAARRAGRTSEVAEAEALTLVCGRSWVFQRVQKLQEARLAAEESLRIGRDIRWDRNTAFCLKCIGRIYRLEAEQATGEERTRLLFQSETSLTDAINAFSGMSDAIPDDVGECHSLLARTYLVAGRIGDARVAAREAAGRLDDPSTKEYLDLQILLGDLVLTSDPKQAESYYREVIDREPGGDSQKSEIVARALRQRGLSRRRQGDATAAIADFRRAAAIWRALADPAEAEAEWQALVAEGAVEERVATILASERAAVRVRTIRLHRDRLASLRGIARRGDATPSHWDQVIKEARRQIAVEHVEWE